MVDEINLFGCVVYKSKPILCREGCDYLIKAPGIIYPEACRYNSVFGGSDHMIESIKIGGSCLHPEIFEKKSEKSERKCLCDVLKTSKKLLKGAVNR